MICSEPMATLELSSSSITLEQGTFSSVAVSMQRPRGMGRAGPREASGDAGELEPLPTSTNIAAIPPRPSRTNSKLKVLVRSHAMREETSPPREPTPTPCITLIPSPSSSPPAAAAAISTSPQPPQQPCLIFSPSGSPTTIMLDTSPAISPNHRSETATVRTQDALSSALQRKFNGNLGDSTAEVFSKSKCDVKDKCAVTKTFNSDMITNSNSSPMQTSNNQKNCVKPDTQRNVDNNTRGRSEQTHYICDCFNTNCTKCSKNNERNINNNSNNINNNNVVSGVTSHSSNTLTVSRASVKHKLRHQSSSQGSFEGNSSTSPCLSRDSSTEQYTDTTGIDLTQFILETLNKNAKDRVMMLKIEQELVSLAKDKIKTHFKFPPMSSYQRMLVHRCAAYFGMDHNIEISGKCVVVNKTKSTRIPDLRFKDHIREDFLFPEEPRRSILKRDSNSFEDCNYKSPDRQFDNRRSKSFEEREEEYEKARRRIFKDGSMQDCDSQEDFNWAEMPWPESECSKIRLLPPEQSTKQNRLLKVQSVDGKSETFRPCVAKSYSFGGYGGSVSVLTRGDSVTSTHSAGPRLLTKQDSSTSTISWRLSPSSSGYKSQSQRSDSVTPSPTATPHQLSDASGKNSLEGVDPIRNSITEETVEQAQQTDNHTDTASGDSNQLVWAVTDMQSVPKGSVLIDPQTGHPLTNQDGSIYHFDPSNPPPGFNTSKPPPSPPKIPSPQKSPVKEQQPPQSPKKQPKSRSSPLKNKSCFINSSTSPSLPMTPPVQQPTQQPVPHPVAYTPNTPMENPTNMPLQPYPVYPNGFVPPNVPTGDGAVPVYQPQLGMVYSPYGMPPPYENRSEPSVAELSGYFVNMAVSDPTAAAAQSVGYQTQSSGYWGQQPVTYYQPPANQQQQQRYPVQIPVHGQNQGTYMSTSYPPNYVPVTPNPPPVPQSTDLVPVYTNPPMQMVYPAQQANPPNPVYIQNPNPMYIQNPVFPQGSVYSNMTYPPSTVTPNPPPTNTTYTSQSFGPATTPNFNQNQSFIHNMMGYDQRQHRHTPKNSNKQCMMPKVQSFAQAQHNSNQSSGGSNSPANTVIAGYFPNTSAPLNYRQCTPPETPPNQNIGYGYPPNYVPHSVIFRPLGGVRASPPVNIRSSRSPTPGPEYPQVGSVDRNQRYSVGPAMYHGMPCIMPGDMRLMTGRAQAPVYRQPYRQQNVAQVTNNENNSAGRSHKARKPRTKVPALPPSGRQSNQSVQANTQQRF